MIFKNPGMDGHRLRWKLPGHTVKDDVFRILSITVSLLKMERTHGYFHAKNHIIHFAKKTVTDPYREKIHHFSYPIAVKIMAPEPALLFSA